MNKVYFISYNKKKLVLETDCCTVLNINTKQTKI